MSTNSISLFDRAIMTQAVADAFKKLNPRAQLKNPVMFVTLVGAILAFEQLFTSKDPFGFVLQIALWLLFTVVFANFAESVAEGRGKAQARALRAKIVEEATGADVARGIARIESDQRFEMVLDGGEHRVFAGS